MDDINILFLMELYRKEKDVTLSYLQIFKIFKKTNEKFENLHCTCANYSNPFQITIFFSIFIMAFIIKKTF